MSRNLVSELDALGDDDSEVAHGKADAILLIALRLHGGIEGAAIADAWERARKRVEFWYA